MTLINPDAHNTEVICLIILADSNENVCKLGNHWSTFVERVDVENRVDPEIEKMNPLAKHVS